MKEKPKYSIWQNVKFMVSFAWKNKEKKVIFIVILLSVLFVSTSLVNLYVTPTILAAVENKVSLTELLITILAFVIMMMICQAATSYVKVNRMYGRIQVRMLLLAKVNEKASTTSYPNMLDEKFKKLLAKAYTEMQGNASSIEQIWHVLTLLMQHLLGIVCYAALLSSLNVWVMLAIIVFSVGEYVSTKRINEYGWIHRDEKAEFENRIVYVDDKVRDYTTAKDIRIFGMRPWLLDMKDSAMAAYTAFCKKTNGVYIWAHILKIVNTFLRNGMAYTFLLYKIFQGNLSVAQFLLYFTAVDQFGTWVMNLLAHTISLHKQSQDISMVREFLDYPECFAFEEGNPLPCEANGTYELRLEHVSYKYPGSETEVLKDINLTIYPGEKLAVVGLNGAGKTTLIKLLCGFLDPTEGQVLLNGEDIRKYNRRDYYKVFAAVFQEFSVLAATIATNVAQSEDDVDYEKVERCLSQAGLLEKVKNLPNGWDTYLNNTVYEEAILLSGGETQKLMLARALYKAAPILVLDEPTAALDPIAESEIYQKYNDMTKGKTAIYISHRLASTQFCDRILFIEGRKIAEEGTHEELLAKDGRYKEMFEVQSKYYREAVEAHG